MVKLKFKAMQEIRQAQLVGLLVLVDELEERQIVVLTDRPTAMNISATYEAKKSPMAMDRFVNRSALSVILSYLPDEMKKLMFIEVSGLINGQYNAQLFRRNADIMEIPKDIRISEAILLSIISDIPIYIDDHLWRIQSTAYNANSSGTAIPMNTLPLDMLKKALQESIEREDYESAKMLNDEIHNRFPQEGMK